MAYNYVKGRVHAVIPFTYDPDDPNRPPDTVDAVTEPPSVAEGFASLTWEELEDWAGSGVASRGRTYHRQGLVRDLAATPDGGLLAWVEGSERYATLVELDVDELTSTCTCPYATSCKHAVAVVLRYLELLKAGEVPTTIADGDKRLALLDGEEEWDEDRSGEPTSRAAPARATSVSVSALRSYLETQSREQLLDLVEGLAQSHPAVRQVLQDRIDLASGSTSRLVQGIRRELAKLDPEPRRGSRWYDDGPDYTDFLRVRQRLETLFEQGHADEVVGLGKEILEAGRYQVELSDEGEGSEDITACMAIVYRALPRSSLTLVDQVLWALEAELSDEYDLLQSDAAETFWDLERAPADWSAVADALDRRLGRAAPASEGDYTRTYRRDRLADSLIMALENAGRDGEVIPLAEREAVVTGSYVRLVNLLVAAERNSEAEDWIRKGIEVTGKRLPGIATQLRNILREMREKRGDRPAVAALRADDFFRQPTLGAYQMLRDAAERADVWPTIRTAALSFLETGQAPTELTKAAASMAADAPSPEWPLPRPVVGSLLDAQSTAAPFREALIQIAIAEQRPDDAIRWYDQRREITYGYGYGGAESLGDQVAAAVAATHPDRAIEIWKKRAETLIAQTNVSAYGSAATYLRTARDLLRELGREDEWSSYLADLRQGNKRKWRLVEILDGLAGRPIIET